MEEIAHPVFLRIVMISLGLIVGSFLNVVICRLPEEKSLVKPNSHCPSCKIPIKIYDNIPVISWIILRGKCRVCNERIGLQYPLVEILTGLSFWLALEYFYPYPVYVGMAVIFLSMLIALAFIDFKHMILPDELTYGGAVLFLGYSFFNPMISPKNAFIAGIGSALAFAGILLFYKKVRKIDGMGWGDVKMMVMLGGFLGVHKLLVATLAASFSGLLVGVFFIIFKGKDMKLALPFGTFLALGSYISVFWADAILGAVRSIFPW